MLRDLLNQRLARPSKPRWREAFDRVAGDAPLLMVSRQPQSILGLCDRAVLLRDARFEALPSVAAAIPYLAADRLQDVNAAQDAVEDPTEDFL